MIDSQIPAVAKFFFLTVKNPEKTHEAIYKTTLRLDKIYKADPKKEEDSSILVFWTYHYWKKAQNKSKPSFFSKHEKSDQRDEKRFVIPEHVDLSAWRQYLRQTTEEEALYVVWSKVLNISDYHIAKGVGLSDGTVRYRIGNSLKKIAKALEA